MQLIISGKNFQLTPSLKTYVEEKLSKLSRYWPRVLRARAELSMNRHHKHGEIFTAYVWLETPGPDIRLSATANDIRACIDLLYPKLERQMIRAKQKQRRQ